LNSKDPISNDW